MAAMFDKHIATSNYVLLVYWLVWVCVFWSMLRLCGFHHLFLCGSVWLSSRCGSEAFITLWLCAGLCGFQHVVVYLHQPGRAGCGHRGSGFASHHLLIYGSAVR